MLKWKRLTYNKSKNRKVQVFSVRLKNKLTGYKRVVDVARKPTREEFSSSMKITGSGIILIGAIGFVIFLAYFILTKLVV